MINDMYFNADVIKHSLELLRTGAKPKTDIGKIATGKYGTKLKVYQVRLINLTVTTILISIPLIILYVWLTK